MRILFFLLISFSLQSASAQLVIRHWNESLQLDFQKEELWKEKTIYRTEINSEVTKKHKSFHTQIDANGTRTNTVFDKSEKVESTSKTLYPDGQTEITEFDDGNVESKKYNEEGKLIEERWKYPDGSEDLKYYEYENGLLVKIRVEDDFGKTWEKLVYENGKMTMIESYKGKKKLLMQQRFTYADGLLTKMERIQKKEVNKVVYYQYDEQGRLNYVEEEKINRLTGRKMGPEIYTYTYHPNDKLKEKKWLIYLNEEKSELKYEYVDQFDEQGLLIQEVAKNYVKGTEEITDHVYTF